MNSQKDLFKNYLLYGIGILGFVLSGFQLTREFKIEYLIGLLGAISFLITEYFFVSVSTQLSLQKKNKIELEAIARELAVRNTKDLTKKDLIKSILTKRRRQLGLWTRIKHILLGTAIVLVFVLGWLVPISDNIPPSYGLAFYKTENGRMKLIDPDSIKCEATAEDIISNTLKLPIQIAIRNEESEPIKIVKVVLTYPSEYQVMSTGSPKIDPSSRSLVYEHDLETLEPTENFTPLKTIDTLIFPFKFSGASTIALSRDSIPVGCFILYDEALLQEKVLNVEIEIYCENRPVIHGDIKVHVTSNITSFFDLPDGDRSRMNQFDTLLFTSSIDSLSILKCWESLSVHYMTKLKYIRGKSGSTQFQYMYVDNILKRLSVDTNYDNLIDYVLVNSGRDSNPDYRLNGGQNRYMFDWEPQDWQ